ncbi:uncharacterized protein [Eurosta solidaginis]|uniref:uncharacterized protein isoform X3 n=1 Tax=Eurosta solidaginis TaxID=178769 RepID=UPI0035307E18
MAEVVCKVWSSDRRIKKLFMAAPVIQAIIEEAKKFDIQGTKLVLESDGTEISSNSVLEYYLKNNKIFMLLENEEWTERPTAATVTIPENYEVFTESQPSPITSSIIPLAQNAYNSNQYILMTGPTDTTDDSDCTTLTVSSGARTSSSETTPEGQI